RPSSISPALIGIQLAPYFAGAEPPSERPDDAPEHQSLEDTDNGRSEKKNLAVAPWHAPLGGRAEEADLRRGQGLGRASPPAPSRPQDRHVQGPAGPEEKMNPEGLQAGGGSI